ncbi:MAG: hypothetical protein B7Z40_09620 [Bosea sp. 12-68-7]|nr:MAG: hypothetical protein B7Z40_09620 [Bosea sp. 12-68-7]
MASIKAHEADRALARLDPAYRLVLIYGPDAGLVSERAAALARAHVDDPQDAFQLVRMSGDDIAGDPLRLVDEANTIGMFGGRRAIRVSPTAKMLLGAVEPLLATPSQDAIVIVEAGDLQRTNPLRTACERARTALAVPCYGDAARDLGTIIDEMVRAAGKSIDRTSRSRRCWSMPSSPGGCPCSTSRRPNSPAKGSMPASCSAPCCGTPWRC